MCPKRNFRDMIIIFQALTTLAMLLIAMKATKNLVSVPLVLKNDTKQNKQVLKVGTFLGMPVNIFFSKLEKYETVIYKNLTGGWYSQGGFVFVFSRWVFTARKRSCGKVMFLHLPVILFTQGSSTIPLPSCTRRPSDQTPTPDQTLPPLGPDRS